MNANEKIRRATAAERLLNDSLLVEAFDGLRQEYVTAWENTSARDTDARERLWQAYHIVGKVKSHLRSVLDSGKLEQKEIEDMEKRAEPRRKRFGVV